jgi:UPF0716 family protein affecting phage T7 exclusion
VRRALSTAGLVLLAVPIIEIVVAVVVGRRIGADQTIGLILLGCLGGLWVLRWAGTGALRELRELRQAGVAGAGMTGAQPVGRDAGETSLKVVAGLLLVFPGLVTDILGLLLLVPAIRRAVVRRIVSGLRRRVELAARRRTVPGETVQGVTVTSRVEDDPGTTKPPLTAGPGTDSPPRRL